MFNLSDYHIKDNITPEDIKELIRIDDLVYGTEVYAGTYDICKKWFTKNNQIYTVLFYKNKIIGYINLMPLNKTTYLKMKSGQISDLDIESKNIVRFGNKGASCILASIIILSEHRNKQVTKMFIEHFLQKIKKLNVLKIISVAVSEHGERFINKFQNVNFVSYDKNGDKIYEIILWLLVLIKPKDIFLT